MIMNPTMVLDDYRAAQADALARAGGDERASTEAVRRSAELEKLLAAAEQREQAERLAAEQADARTANEAQVRRLAIEKARAEQAAEAALRARLEAERRLCAEAQRKEQALADLAAASAARAKREAEFVALEKEKAAAERAALHAAQQRVRDEQAAEMLALAKAAAAQEAARLATQRLAAEREALNAAAAREQAEAGARAAQQSREAAEAELAEMAKRLAAIPPVTGMPDRVEALRAPPAAFSARRRFRWMALLATGCLAAGVLAGFWFAASSGPEDIPQLQLDYRLSSTK